MKKKIDQKTFSAVKTLTAGGATIQEIVDYLGVCSAVVSRIRSAETFEEYRQMLAARALAYKEKHKKQEAKPEVKPEKQEEKPMAITMLPEYYRNNQALQLLREQNEYLKLISNKLAFIVEQLA